MGFNNNAKFVNTSFKAELHKDILDENYGTLLIRHLKNTLLLLKQCLF